MPDVIVYRTTDQEFGFMAPHVVNLKPLGDMLEGLLMALSQPEGGKFYITDHCTSRVVVVEPVDRIIPPFNPADTSGNSLSGQSNGIP